MLLWLMALFIVLPMAEVYLLVQIGERIGFWPTLAGVVVVSAVGAALARREGMRALSEVRASLARRELPSEALTSAALVLAGGILLVTPGVITDLAGLLLLFPPTRRWVGRYARRRFQRAIDRRAAPFQVPGMPRSETGEREIQGEAKVRRNPPPSGGEPPK